MEQLIDWVIQMIERRGHLLHQATRSVTSELIKSHFDYSGKTCISGQPIRPPPMYAPQETTRWLDNCP